MDGYYEIVTSIFTIPDSTSSTLFAEVYPVDGSAYSVDFAGGQEAGTSKHGSYTTQFLTKGTVLKIRIFASGDLTIRGIQENNPNARGLNRVNTVFSIKYITPYVTDNIRITNLENV
jgi:hypothetical protein